MNKSNAQMCDLHMESTVTVNVTRGRGCQGKTRHGNTVVLNLKPVWFVQVPLFLRSTVKSYAAVPGGGGAYTIAAQITIFGSNPEDVFVHESTHAFDGTFQLSTQQAYLQALYADSCTPDEYAQNSNVECFAQGMVVFLYYLWKPSFFQNPCLSQQIEFVSSLTVPGVQSYKSSVGESCMLTHQLSHVLSMTCVLVFCASCGLIVCNRLLHNVVMYVM